MADKLSLCASIADLVQERRAWLERHERLAHDLLSRSAAPEVRRYAPGLLHARELAALYTGTTGGKGRVLKVYGDAFASASRRVPELLGLFARGLTLGDDALLTDREHLCLPETYAFDEERDEILVLFPLLATRTVPCDDSATVTYFRAGVAGLGALRAAGYVHGDISPANLLARTSDPASATWIDFDLVYRLDADEYMLALQERYVLIGTPPYWPESWLFQDDDLRWDRIDFIALGYLLAEFLLGYHAPLRAGPYTLIRHRAPLGRTRRIRRRLRAASMVGLPYVFARLVDEQDGYHAMAEVEHDLGVVLAGNGASLMADARHRSSWQRHCARPPR